MPSVGFIVEGSPVSHQTKNKKALGTWKAKVRAEAAKAWMQPPMTGLLQCTIIHFFAGSDVLMDDDNLVKPIRDALNKLVYTDDRQIRHSFHAQMSNAGRYQISGAAKLVVDALREGKVFVYIRVEDAPAEPQLPR
jgi:Holliday junction resolvase RusA-like endonuclease